MTRWISVFLFALVVAVIAAGEDNVLEVEVWRRDVVPAGTPVSLRGGPGWHATIEKTASFPFVPVIPSKTPGKASRVVAAVSSDPEGVSLTQAYPDSVPLVLKGGFHRFGHCEGMQKQGRPGEPLIPSVPVALLLPPGREVDRVMIIPGGLRRMEGTYDVEPAPQPVPFSHAGRARPPAPDPRIYSSDEPFPGSFGKVVGVQYKRGYPILLLSLNPILYNPRSGRLGIYSYISVHVTTIPARRESRISPTGADAQEVAGLIDNRDALPLYLELGASGVGSVPVPADSAQAPPPPYIVDPMDDFDYVVITSEAFRDAPLDCDLQDLMTLRNSQGLECCLVTVEDILAGYSGRDDTEKIRNFIIDAYNDWGTRYVLLGGDTDVVPARRMRCSASWVTEWLDADLYYGCLDGDFDYNGNNYFGELDDGEDGGLPDFFYEVYVGRVAADNAMELSNFVYKTLMYEHTLISNELDPYLFRYIMAGEQLDSIPTYGDDLMEALINGYGSPPTDSAGLAEYTSQFRCYDRPGDGDDGPGAWTGTTLINLFNSDLYSWIHHCGHANETSVMHMSLSDVDALTNTNYFFAYSQGCYCGDISVDCIAEHFAASTRSGAVGVIMNSSYGWYSPGAVDGPSQRFQRMFVDAMYAGGAVRAAAANAYSKEKWGAYMWTDYNRWCAYCTNLLGDPYLQLPAITDSPMLAVGDRNADDSAGNGDGFINPGETIDLDVQVVNAGTLGAAGVSAILSCSSPYVTILSGNAQYGDISPGGSRLGTPSFQFRTDSGTPLDTELQFTLDIIDGDGNAWSDEFSEIVRRSLSISGRVTDAENSGGVFGATVYYDGPISGSVTTAGDGSYNIYPVVAGDYVVTASHPSYLDGAVNATVPPSAADVDIALTYPNIVVSPSPLTAFCPTGASTVSSLRVEDTGTAALEYRVFQVSGHEGTVLKMCAALPGGYSYGYGVEWAAGGLWRILRYNDGSGDVYRIWRQDVDTGSLTQEIPLPAVLSGTPRGLAWDGRYMWVGDYTYRKVYQLDPASGEVLNSLSVAGSPYDLAWDGDGLWVVCSGADGNVVARYDATGSMVSSFVTGTSPKEYSLAWDGAFLWTATSQIPAAVKAYDTDGTLRYQFEGAGSSCYGGMTWDGLHFWFSPYGDPVQVDSGRVPWLSVAPRKGTVPAKDYVDLSAGFDAAGLSDGDHYTALWICSNDIDTPEAVLQVTLTVGPGSNLQPVADITASPESGASPLPVGFDASASYDPDGSIVHYEYDFDYDGLCFSADDAGPGLTTTSHTYGEAGIYVAAVRITDDGSPGLTSMKTVTLNVTSSIQPPVAVLDSDCSLGPAPLQVTFDASGSYDPDGAIALYEYDFDYDGLFFDIEASGPALASVPHEYSAAGGYVAAVRVTDDGTPSSSRIATMPVEAVAGEYVIIPADKDTFLRQEEGSQPHDEHEMGLWADNHTSENCQILLHFPTDALSAEAIILHAAVRMYCYRENASGSRFDTVEIFRCSSNWEETTATWQSDANNGTFMVKEAVVPNLTDLDEMDPPQPWDETMTGLVRDWVKGSQENHGIRIVPNQNLLDVRFSDSENSRNLGDDFAPALIIRFYTGGPDNDPPGIDLGSVEIKGTVSDNGILQTLTIDGTAVPCGSGTFQHEAQAAIPGDIGIEAVDFGGNVRMLVIQLSSN